MSANSPQVSGYAALGTAFVHLPISRFDKDGQVCPMTTIYDLACNSATNKMYSVFRANDPNLPTIRQLDGWLIEVNYLADHTIDGDSNKAFIHDEVMSLCTEQKNYYKREEQQAGGFGMGARAPAQYGADQAPQYGEPYEEYGGHGQTSEDFQRYQARK